MVNLNRTKRFLFDLKCTKIAGGWGSAPDPAGELTALPQVLDGLREEEKGRKGRGGEGRGGEGRGEEGEVGMCPLYEILNTPLLTESPRQSPPPLNVGLRPRAQITSSFVTYVL